ncbi:ATPase, T2SS/T4P/T4SS family [Natrinema salifodinae]|uniref:Flagellar protein FlaI n=1 Tax=Natrinema salifodinae TaxID=1202768 RepID=A0A1I0N884_9EURY|nr:ATPase, T2SS/T4P/T4SS family [Natrinema salifodinae]SEV97165.1 flagellar protein FlaI [Natrinema salifodinae]
MAIDEADQSDAGDFSEGEASDAASEDERSHESGADPGPVLNAGARVGEYTWEEFMDEYGHGDEVSVLYPDEERTDADDQLGLDTDEDVGPTVPSGDDWDRVEFDPEAYLGHHPDDLTEDVLPTAGDNAETLWDTFLEYVDPETTPVVKDTWTWEHYKWEYYYEDDGSRPRDSDGEIVRHDEEEALGFDPDTLEQRLAAGNDAALELDEIVEERTVNVQDDIDEDEFFSTAAGNTTVSNRYDLEKAVPLEKKTHFREVERYWVNKPYAYVVIFHSEKENEKKYYLIEPYQNEIETELQEFLSGKLRTAIKYSEDGIKEKATEDGRRSVIEDETRKLLRRYDLFEATAADESESIVERLRGLLDDEDVDLEDAGPSQLEGIEVRPEPAILEDDPDTLSEYQVEKLLYALKRNFIGYERIDGIKHDINVEDISCDGYNSPVFVYHSEYEQIISNVYHGEDELDDFVVKLAQRSGKGISKRLPQVDATLPDGSRAQLTLGEEVSDHGTNYTIRQFKDVPFTPIDLINWNTFSLDEMAFLWLAIENHKSLIFAGGTASGKTTSLNAVSLFIPSSAKIVSIEDTREVELPQRNWIASVTRPSFSDDEQGDVDEFDLLEAALRQRPDYIVMGEIRGEEGRTLFQVMSTGHTTYTTFHADSVDEVLKRFTTDPINVSKTMFTALDLVSIQTQTRVQGRKVRRNKSLTEINHYEAEHDEINVQDVYQWQAETDEYLKMGDSNTLEEIQFDRGWSKEKLEEELFKREVILAYLIKNGLNTYTQVAATIQAFINDPDTILTLIANGQLEDSLEDLREMESVLIDVDQEKEELVPRPEATDETYNLSMDLLERAEESLFEEYRGKVPSGLASVLSGVEEATNKIEVDGTDAEEFDFAGDLDQAVEETEWELGDGATEFAADDGSGAAGDDAEPAWLNDDTGFDIDGDNADTADAATAEAGSGASAETAASPDADSELPVAVDSDADAADAANAANSNSADGGSGVSSTTSTESSESRSVDAEDESESPERSAQSTRSADSTATAAGSESEPTGSTVFPGDDTEDEDLGGLFDDMGETIDELEEPTQPDQADGDGAATDSDPDAVFAQDDLDSIFDPDSDGSESAADSGDEVDDGESTTVSERDQAPTIELDDESVSESTAAAAESTADADEPESGADEPESSADVDESETDATAETGAGRSEKTISIDVPDVENESEDADVDGDQATGETTTEPTENTDDDPESPTIELDNGAGSTDPPDASDGGSAAGSESPSGNEPTPEASSTADEDETELETDDSIFGDESGTVFSDDDEDDAADDDGSLFDERDADDEESIFRDDGDAERTDGNTGIFDTDGDDEGDDA